MAKKALLIGLNYPGKMKELKGSFNDVRRMKQCLMDPYGFSEEDIVVLIDTDQICIQPTADNIRSELSLLINSANPGDVLFVHFSGHGDRDKLQDNDHSGFVQSIIAADGQRITDDEFRAFVDMVPRGCWITIVADCCHSGGLIKGAKEQIGDSTNKGRPSSRSEFGNFSHGDYRYVNERSLTQFDILKQKTGEEASPKVKFGLEKGHKLVESIAGPSKSSLPDRGILLSACQSYQKAMEVSFSGNSDEVYGVFSNAIQATIKETNGRVTNWELVRKTRKILERQGFHQIPGLYCSDHHTDAPFLCADPIKTQTVKMLLFALLIFFCLSLGPLIWPHVASKYN